MNILKRFLGGLITAPAATAPEATRTQQEQPEIASTVSTRDENAALADDPIAFSRWIFQAIVETMTDERAASLCAPEDVASKFGITPDEQRAAANEFILMNALGACMFTGLNFSLEYHLKFKREMAIQVSKRLFGGHIQSRIEEIDSAIEVYLSDILDLTAREHLFDRFSEKYFQRVYPSNPNSLSMQLGHFAKIPLDLSVEALKITQDAYCKLRHGLPYKTIVAIEELFGRKGGSENGQAPNEAA